MKKHLHNRNERLFNKLFEKQGVKADFEKKPLQEAAPIVEDDKDPFVKAEDIAKDKARDMIRAGAPPARMFKFMGELDKLFLYLFDGNEDTRGVWGRISPFRKKENPLNELDPPQMAAWSHIYYKKKKPHLGEEERAEGEGDSAENELPKYAAHDVKAQDALTTHLVGALKDVLGRQEISNWIKRIDTAEELTWFVGLFVETVNEIAGADLTDQEIDRSAFDLRKYLQQLRDKKKDDEGVKKEATAHVILNPEEKDPKY